MNVIHDVSLTGTVKLEDDTSYVGVEFDGCTIVTNPRPQRISFMGCDFRNCIYFYDGMEVHAYEWFRLVAGPPIIEIDLRP